MAKSNLRSEQFLSLTCGEKKRYLSKIELLDGVDPYTLKKGDLSNDIAVLPPLRYFFITSGVAKDGPEWAANANLSGKTSSKHYLCFDGTGNRRVLL